MITASEPRWISPFTGLSPQQFGTLITALRKEGAVPVRRGRPWGLPLEDRVLLVIAYWRTNMALDSSPSCSGYRSRPPTASSTTPGPPSLCASAGGFARKPC